MIEQLFGSKTRVKLLKLFMTNPNRSFYVREITRKIDEQINSVRRELSNLLSIGIISSDSSNNRLYYEVDQNFEHYRALASLFGGKSLSPAVETTGKNSNKPESSSPDKRKSGPKLTEREKSLGNVQVLILSGVFTRDEDAPVDVLIVGDVTPSSLENYIEDLEDSTSHEVRYATFTASEFEYRMQIKDKFVTELLDSKCTVKVDKLGLSSEVKGK